MWKNKYHISPEFGLLNDPNGLIYWNNEYHVFYQLNPNGCEHKTKCWAHIKSKDFVNWEVLPIALKPEDWFDKDGCYSGSAIEKDGKLYLLYTGNVKNNGIREAYQCLAVSEDGINFEKKGPVIHDKDIPIGYTRHFRDPKISEKNGIYTMVIGAQKIDLTGTIVVFTSENLIDWNFEGEIIKNEFGYMCECPDYINIEKDGVLLFSPQGLEANGYLYNNRYQSGYIVRNLYEENKNDFIELDRGFEFYAPQTFLDENGDNILIGWMGMPEELEHPTVEAGNWIHSLTLPRKLSLKNNKIIQTPYEKLKKLRKETIELDNITINSELDLKEYNIEGKTYELILEFSELKEEIELNLRVGKDEKTTFIYNPTTQVAILDRNLSGKGYKGIRKCELKELRKIHIFVDETSIEIFLNDGEEVFTGNIYPNKLSLGIEIKSEIVFTIPRIKFYKI